MVHGPNGNWVHTTYLKDRAHSLVNVTIYPFRTATGLRNPFLAQVRGTVGNVMSLDGKRVQSVKQDGPGHTFTIADLGVSIPLQGVADDAKNQCTAGPCTLDQAHTTIKFSFRTGAPAMYRAQPLEPRAAGA